MIHLVWKMVQSLINKSLHPLNGMKSTLPTWGGYTLTEEHWARRAHGFHSQKDADQWLQIDLFSLGNKYTRITGVATQGRRNERYQQWVSKYKLQYSNDGVNFRYYKEQGQTADKVL